MNGARELDAVIVGAGFAGLYMLHTLRALGYGAKVLEAGDDVGGTWYWNRYPGARCDTESLAYSFTFSQELLEEFTWSERFATQPEILRYADFVADRLDLRRDIEFRSRVTGAHYDAGAGRWQIAIQDGSRFSARFCVMATGCLSVGRVPDIPGLQDFKGPWYHTGSWPHEAVDFRGKRVGVVGTGASGIQLIPVIADLARELVVFQRTPSFSVPARNAPLDPAFIDRFRKNHEDFVQGMRTGRIFGSGDLAPTPEERVPVTASAMDMSAAAREQVYARQWSTGGSRYMVCFPDQMINAQSNEEAANFIRRKIKEIVKDPCKAETLTPRGYPLGAKRICLDTGYYATFNRPNVSLVDTRNDPIVEILEDGLRTRRDRYELDALVFATGFDAFTGALDKIDIRGRDGVRLHSAWEAGPATYLGLMTAGFPNLFMITGPGSPSVLSNVLYSIEQHVEWIGNCLRFMRERGADCIEPTTQAQAEWVRHVDDVARATLFPLADSWYCGANVPGKPRTFIPYVAGVAAYREICDSVAADGYRGMVLSTAVSGR